MYQSELSEIYGLRHLKLKLEELRSRAEGTASKPITGMPRGGGSTNDTIEDIILLEQKLEREWGIVEPKLEKLKPSEKRVIEERYKNGKSWKQVADCMGVKKPTIRSYHSRAINSIKNA